MPPEKIDAITAAKPAGRGRASLVQSSEQVRIEAALWAELRKGLYCVSEAMLAKDDSERRAARSDATSAFENVRGLLNHSHFPITEPSIQEKLRQLETAVGSFSYADSLLLQQTQ